jgi:signal transduction histidine kinase
VERPSRILIIDDEEIVIDSCLAVLEGAGYQIVTAPDGTEGLKQAREATPDLVLVDLMMPGISGFEVLEGMRSIDPTIVTIVITGYSTVESAVEAMKRGAFDFLPKPFNPDELRMIVQRGLERRRLVLEATALRRERELLQQNFAAIISHELRSPLSAVQQNLFVLTAELDDKLDESQRGRFERLKGRLTDLLKMIQSWLRAVSDPGGKLGEELSPISARSAVAKAIESVQPHATRKDITITDATPESLPPVLGDEAILTEALVNLVGNAVKYTRAGGRVAVGGAVEAGQVVITIVDTGVGIPADDVPFVFDAFYRGHAGADAEAGAGLGLALTRRIIEAHHGTISVDSEVGRGTTFTVRLPVHTPENPSPPGEVAAAPTTLDPGDKR